jgi:hypothetical protein
MENLKAKILKMIIADNLSVIADLCEANTKTITEAEELYNYITKEFYPFN